MSAPRQSMGVASADRIVVRGHDLCRDLAGVVPFGDVVFLQIVGRLPSTPESTIGNAVLTCLMEHGMTAGALAARLTAAGSPEAVQAAVAAGVLGAGSVFLGALEDCAVLLGTLHDGHVRTKAPLPEIVRTWVRRTVCDGGRVPGLGHPIHRDQDPRTIRLFELATELGAAGDALHTITLLRDTVEEETGRSLPINADGACAAVLLDLGFPPQLLRCYAAVARAAGAAGHVAEEITRPTTPLLLSRIDELVPYEDPSPLFEEQR
ncbi:citryl-CoA lyase [Pseudonocardia ailaonensis]|uniref:citrate synthase (unknown stereospecificity) n=1 Tax=Pseudonocardia ailaonensis TaxID=367279 RepID=A0ABN2NC70_9PSEU